MKKTLIAIALGLSVTAIAQENESTSPERYEIEGLYLGMPKAAAEDEIAKFCLKNSGSYKTEEIKGDYGVIFADVIGCEMGRYEYLYIRAAQDKVYDITKGRYINVEGNYENSDLLLERAESVYGKPALVLDNKDGNNRLTWEMDYKNLPQLPEFIQEKSAGYHKFEGEKVSTIACWGKCTTASVDSNVYMRGGDKSMSLMFENTEKLYLGQRMTDFSAIDAAWKAYQDAENEQINAEKAANKSIIDSVSF